MWDLMYLFMEINIKINLKSYRDNNGNIAKNKRKIGNIS